MVHLQWLPDAIWAHVATFCDVRSCLTMATTGRWGFRAFVAAVTDLALGWPWEDSHTGDAARRAVRLQATLELLVERVQRQGSLETLVVKDSRALRYVNGAIEHGLLKRLRSLHLNTYRRCTIQQPSGPVVLSVPKEMMKLDDANEFETLGCHMLVKDRLAGLQRLQIDCSGWYNRKGPIQALGRGACPRLAELDVTAPTCSEMREVGNTLRQRHREGLPGLSRLALRARGRDINANRDVHRKQMLDDTLLSGAGDQLEELKIHLSHSQDDTDFQGREDPIADYLNSSCSHNLRTLMLGPNECCRPSVVRALGQRASMPNLQALSITTHDAHAPVEVVVKAVAAGAWPRLHSLRLYVGTGFNEGGLRAVMTGLLKSEGRPELRELSVRSLPACTYVVAYALRGGVCPSLERLHIVADGQSIPLAMLRRRFRSICRPSSM